MGTRRASGRPWRLGAAVVVVGFAPMACGEDSGVSDRSGPRPDKPAAGQGGGAGTDTMPGGQADTTGGTSSGGSAGASSSGSDSGGSTSGGSSAGGAGGESGAGEEGGTAMGGSAGATGASGGTAPGGGTSAGGSSTSGASSGGASGGVAGAGVAGGAGTGAVLLSDDFELGYLRGYWQHEIDSFGDHHGAWDVVRPDGNYIYLGVEQGSDVSWALRHVDWTDVRIEIEARYAPHDDTTPWSIFIASRLESPQRHQRVSIRHDGSVSLNERADGVTTTLASTNTTLPGLLSWFKITFVSSGSTLAAYIDDVLVIQASNGTLTNGGIGLAVNELQVEFDNLRVTVP